MLLQLIALTGSALLPLSAEAQSARGAMQSPLQATFEIVSIHPMRQDDVRPEHIDNPSRRGYLNAINMNLRSLLEIARHP